MPWDVGHICQIAALVLNRRMSVVLPAIGYLITMKRFRLVILASGKLIPLIVRDAVAVCVETDHNDARLSRPALAVGIGQFIECISPNPEIALARHIYHRVVETERNITAISSERNQHIVCPRNRLLTFFQYVGIRVAGFIFRHLVDKLSRSRTIFIYTGNVSAVLHLLVKHIHRKLKMIRRVRVDDVERKIVDTLRFSQKDIAVGCRHLFPIDCPPILLPRQRRVQRQFLHTRHIVDVVDAKIDHRHLIGTSPQNQRQQ